MPIFTKFTDKTTQAVYEFQSVEPGEYMYRCTVNDYGINVLTTYCEESDFGGYVYLDRLDLDEAEQVENRLKIPLRLNDETKIGRVPMMQCFIVEIIDTEGNETEYTFQHKTASGQLITPS